MSEPLSPELEQKAQELAARIRSRQPTNGMCSTVADAFRRFLKNL